MKTFISHGVYSTLIIEHVFGVLAQIWHPSTHLHHPSIHLLSRFFFLDMKFMHTAWEKDMDGCGGAADDHH